MLHSQPQPLAPQPTLLDLLRQAMDGVWPTPPDLTALLDRMETAR